MLSDYSEYQIRCLKIAGGGGLIPSGELGAYQSLEDLGLLSVKEGRQPAPLFGIFWRGSKWWATITPAGRKALGDET